MYAQVTTTTIHGTVTDQSGAIVAGAHVTVSNTDTGVARSIDSAADGQYRVEFLPVGPYRIEATAPGFRKFVQSGLVLEINQIARVDAVMQVGSAAETLEVTEQASEVKMRRSRNCLSSTVMSTRFLRCPRGSSRLPTALSSATRNKER
jgi:hypothetical protein